jgi:hypothetical protein
VFVVVKRRVEGRAGWPPVLENGENIAVVEHGQVTLLKVVVFLSVTPEQGINQSSFAVRDIAIRNESIGGVEG